jgi:azurin
MKKSWIFITAISVIVLGCAEEKHKSTETTPEQVQQAVPEMKVVKGEKQIVELTLGSNDQMKYDQKELRVPADSKVILTLKHNGTMPKQAMGHNFVLLKSGTDLAAFGAEAVAAGIENEHVPDSEAVIAHTSLIGGGEQSMVTFDAPSRGRYDFICSFPGHYALMKGTLIVE